MSQIEYLARCHCGNLTARFQTALEPSAWRVRACQCSFCRSHGMAVTSDPAGSLDFRSSDPERVQRYRLGGRTADFLLCRECGVVVGVETWGEAGRFAVLNVLALRPPLTELPAAQPVDFAAETAEMRQQRRESRWTPVVADSL